MHDDRFHPAYFGTHFRVAEPLPSWPASFTIITGHTTTGEEWSDDENQQADVALRAVVEAHGRWFHRVTGFDPATQHAEPGWALCCTIIEALELGRRFRQDAVFMVTNDELTVHSCRDGAQATVGRFSDRVRAAVGP